MTIYISNEVVMAGIIIVLLIWNLILEFRIDKLKNKIKKL